ncbi:MAG: hypothetical protein Kow00105_03100 [Phycisphaeraceae bacterium]
MIEVRQGLAPLPADEIHEPVGRFTRIEGESYYAIEDYDSLDPFLISVVSDSDHWMYVSSNGGLTAGRGNPDQALFPYDTEDKLHQCHWHTGPVTSMWVRDGDGTESLWEPFQQSAKDHYRIRRNIYKSESCNTLIFEEINQDLDLSFRYRWCFSDAFGFVRLATLANAGDREISVSLVDGLMNVQPAGVMAQIHWRASCLVDAYRDSRVDERTGLGVYTLSSMITDRAEPSETMHATVVWSRGLSGAQVFLSADRLQAFRRQGGWATFLDDAEPVLKGRKASYLIHKSMKIAPGQLSDWHIVADVMQDQGRVARLHRKLMEGDGLDRELDNDCRAGTENLRRNVASADGLEMTASRMMSAHHYANVLFNNMRGGVFDHNYDVSTSNLARFVKSRNQEVAQRRADFFNSLDEVISIGTLYEKASKTGDADLIRLCYEYLPLYFSRRHGDPSRPWNHFDIRLKDAHGNRLLAYQGNWRDIFQNWEALCHSFPRFLPGVIAKFLNASTADGYNPYRITDEGIDWEVPDENDPWSNIGYWGDHQIIYLLKLLEAVRDYEPRLLESMLDKEVFSFADVPYTIKPYESLLADPHNTILYDRQRAAACAERVEQIGADGRLLADAEGGVYHANLAEKLLIPALAKLSNLVVDGGIWLNTQRPEWNDANNALVGYGLSVVTMGYLRRYLSFCIELFERAEGHHFNMTGEVAQWCHGVLKALRDGVGMLDSDRVDDRQRKQLLDAVGKVFSDYRQTLYTNGLGAKEEVSVEEAAELCRVALRYIDHSLRANRREDGLYHAYNLMDLSADGKGISIRYLYPMLEGQVAILSSGLLDSQAALEVLETLPNSPLYRPDQNSYLLYPNRELPGFLDKNRIPEDRVMSCDLLRELVEQGDVRVIYRDDEGVYRFAAGIHNGRDLDRLLDDLAQNPEWSDKVNHCRDQVQAVYESVFNHKAFTGRSGGMYGYEGLGCIYWHMVAKLLVAVQECHERAVESGEDEQIVDRLARAYEHVRGGLGFNKTPKEYGAFPTDPYSHTPGFAGARQPGMTGQVKEEILARRKELGVIVRDGALVFKPALLSREAFLKIDAKFEYTTPANGRATLDLPSGSIAFTVCQVPVIYRLDQTGPGITITDASGRREPIRGYELPAALSREVFGRTGNVACIELSLSLAYR